MSIFVYIFCSSLLWCLHGIFALKLIRIHTHTLLTHNSIARVLVCQCHDIAESFVYNWLLCYCLRLRCNILPLFCVLIAPTSTLAKKIGWFRWFFILSLSFIWYVKSFGLQLMLTSTQFQMKFTISIETMEHFYIHRQIRQHRVDNEWVMHL